MKRAAVIAGLLGLAVVLTGCGVGADTETDTVSYEVNDQVAALRVAGDTGNVEVVESQRQGIKVTEVLTWRKSKPKTSHDVQGDTLDLKFECPSSFGLGAIATTCDVSYQVEVPKGLRVKASTDSGNLTVRGLSGELDARTDSGEIEAEGLAVKQAVAKTDSGTVDLAFTGSPDKVKAGTDSGDISIGVPEGAYKVNAKTSSGDKNIGIDADPSAPRSIELSSDTGSLEVHAP